MTEKKKTILKMLSKLDEKQLAEMIKDYKAKLLSDSSRSGATSTDKPTAEQSSKSAHSGEVFKVFDMPENVKKQLKIYSSTSDNALSSHTAKWVNDVKNLPHFTTPLPSLNKEFLDNARRIWDENVSGLDEIYEKVISHIVGYIRTGNAAPMIFHGKPGCGKSHVARVIGKILNLYTCTRSANEVAKGCGVKGERLSYMASSSGIIASGMLESHSGSYVLVLDEVDKIKIHDGHGGDFQSDLLEITEPLTAKEFRDTFLDMKIDSSHVFIIMTANEIANVSEPLLSRSEVIEFPPINEESLVAIVTNHVLPELEDQNKTKNHVTVPDEILRKAVSIGYSRGICDIRHYKKMIKTALGNGLRRSITEGKAVTLELGQLCDYGSSAYKQKPIMGFVH